MMKFRFLCFILLQIFCFAPGSLAQDLPLPATGVWNGYNEHLNVVECSNLSDRPFSLLLTVYDNQANIIGERNVALARFATVHILLNDFAIDDAYGTYTINSSKDRAGEGQRIACYTMIYRLAAAGREKPVEYAFALPVRRPNTGTTAGLFNSYQPDGGTTPVFNWLTIYNPDAERFFNAKVYIYDQTGKLQPEQTRTIRHLRPRMRTDLSLGHERGQVVGSYRIVPDNDDIPYGAFLTRYSVGENGEFNFAFPLFAERGSCTLGAMPLSTFDPASNWVEIANPTSLEFPVTVTIRNATGTMVHRSTIPLESRTQRHLFINEFLGDHATGSLHVRCETSNENAKLLLQSVYYGRVENSQAVRWAYASTVANVTAGAGEMSAVPLNTHLGALNWVKYLNGRIEPGTERVSIYNSSGVGVGQRLYSLPGRASIDVPAHDSLGRDATGLVLAVGEPDEIVVTSELLRVFSSTSGRIGYVINVPARVVPATSTFSEGVKVSENGRWFEFRDESIFLIGDSITQAWMELGTDFRQKEYLSALRARGTRAIMIWSYIAVVNQAADSRIGYHAPRIWPWVERSGSLVPPYQFSFIDGSGRAVFNEPYFDRLREFVQLANERDIVVIITIHDGWTKDRFAGHPLNVANGGTLLDREDYLTLSTPGIELPVVGYPSWDRTRLHQFYLERFSDRLIQATGDLPNVIYEILNEGEWYGGSKRSSFHRHFASFFKARTERPVIANNPEDSLVNDGLIDAESYHRPTWRASTKVDDTFIYYSSRWFETSRPKPILFNEPVPEYLGNVNDLDGMMRLMWGTALGGASFFAPNDSNWRFNPSAVNPIFDRIGHASRFFNQLGVRFSRMRPVEELVTNGVCFARAGSEYVIYSESGTSFSLDLTEYNEDFLVRFYNPRTGAFHTVDTEIEGGSIVTISKPTASDWVAWVTRLSS